MFYLSAYKVQIVMASLDLEVHAFSFYIGYCECDPLPEIHHVPITSARVPQFPIIVHYHHQAIMPFVGKATNIGWLRVLSRPESIC